MVMKDKNGGVKLLASIDISTRAPWITQNEQHSVTRCSNGRLLEEQEEKRIK
jgi:hypothetical protein